MVKHLPTIQETWVWSLGWEDPLEDGMAAHSSILAWRIQWTEEPGGLQSTGSQRVRHDWVTNIHTHVYKSFSTMFGKHLIIIFFLKQNGNKWKLYHDKGTFSIFFWDLDSTGPQDWSKLDEYQEGRPYAIRPFLWGAITYDSFLEWPATPPERKGWRRVSENLLM